MTVWGWARRVGLVVLGVAVVEYLAVPQFLEARSELRLFSGASPWLLPLAFALQAASLLAYTALTQTVLSADVQLPFSQQLRIDLTGYGASHVLPGGGASAAALRYRLMTARGIPPDAAVSTAAVESAIAFIGLVATFTGGVALALPGIWSHPAYLSAGGAGAVVLVALWLVLGRTGQDAALPPALVIAPGRWSRGWAARWVAAGLDRALAAARSIIVRAQVLLRQRHSRRTLLGFAAGNWLLDAACLWVCLWAYGVVVHPGALLAAYGAANLLGLLPITPGGLGVIEGVLIPSLILLGAAGGPVVLGVLTWRVLQFWLPIPLAGLAYLSLLLSRPNRNVPGQSSLSGDVR
jgi:uncharacterized membrane protein YbhN (UPF0104 family)